MKRKFFISTLVFLLCSSFALGQIKAKPTIQAPKIEKPVITPLKPGFRVKMLSATVEGKVVLKWVIEEGWLPPKGFNLYKKQNGDYQKIAGPLLERDIPVIKTVDLNGKEASYNLKEIQQMAKKSLPAEREKILLPVEKVPSSAPLFQELSEFRRQQFSPFVGERRPNFQMAKLEQFKNLNLYYQRLGLSPGALPSLKTLRKPIPKIAEDETSKILDARATLLLNSLLENVISQSLGLSYVDSDVVVGKEYDYELRMINEDGSESPVASTSIKVGSDPLPASPKGFMAKQLGVKQVGLRWEPDDREDSAQVIAYEVYRQYAGTRTKLTPKPYVIGLIEDEQGNLMDRITYLTDDNAPLGEVEYQIYGIDAFGRRSPPATVKLRVEDWEKPRPVERVEAKLEGETAIIFWAPSSRLGGTIDPDALYFIYRLDAEEEKPEWVRLNKSPLKLESPREQKSTAKIDLEKKTSPLSFKDTGIEKDHIYRYCITALYEKNGLESAPSPEAVLEVPDYQKPSPPQGLSSQFKPKVRTPKELAFDRRWSGSLQIPGSAVELPTVETAEGKKLGEKKTSGGYGRPYFQETDIGGSVILSWQPAELKKPVRYRIYRANASGYLTLPSSEERKLILPVKNWNLKTIKGSLPPLVAQGKVYEYFSYRSPEDTPPGDWTLLEETENTSFEDVIPKTRPCYYNYQVRVVNRWGIEGEPSFVSIRIPASLKPPTPELVNLTPTLDQGMLLTWKPLPLKEEIVKYIVYRKGLRDLSEKATTHSLPAPAPANAGDMQTGQKNVSVIQRPKSPQELLQRMEILKRIQDYMVVGEVIPGPGNIDKEGNYFFKDLNGVLPEMEYAYFVVAVDKDGWVSEAPPPLTAVSLRTKAEPVLNLKAEYKEGKAILSWMPPAVRGSHYIVGYIVERGRGGGGEFVTMAMGLKETSFSDPLAMPGKEYIYRVIAVDELGNPSEPVSVTISCPQ